MLNGSLTAVPKMPRKVVVELSASEYRTLEELGHGPYRSLSPAQLIRLVAVQLAREP